MVLVSWANHGQELGDLTVASSADLCESKEKGSNRKSEKGCSVIHSAGKAMEQQLPLYTDGNEDNLAISTKMIKVPASEPSFPFPGVYTEKFAHVENDLHVKSLTVALSAIAKRLDTT